ncbi:MAG: hypothetical protein AAFX00_02730 [Pseudomonadota bacterium]
MMARQAFGLLGTLVLLGACDYSTDPADGGFFAGVSGIYSGSYQSRTDALELEVAESQAREERLRAEEAELTRQVARAQTDWAEAKLALARQAEATPNIDAGTAEKVEATLEIKPSGSSDEELLASLQNAITTARLVSEDLAQLAG